MDGRWVWDNLGLWYEIIDVWINAYKNWFLIVCHGCSNTYYSVNCCDSEFLFGCYWLKNQKYCILNKQYTKEEYERLVPKVISKMKSNKEWWEFFPSNISPFWYNETVAQEFYPLEKSEAKKIDSNGRIFSLHFQK